MGRFKVLAIKRLVIVIVVVIIVLVIVIVINSNSFNSDNRSNSSYATKGMDFQVQGFLRPKSLYASMLSEPPKP